MRHLIFGLTVLGTLAFGSVAFAGDYGYYSDYCGPHCQHERHERWERRREAERREHRRWEERHEYDYYHRGS